MHQGYEKEIIKTLPQWKRARDYHLYDTQGTRYIDFWQEDGWALCGHKPRGVAKIIKNTLSRGLWSSASAHVVARLKKKIHVLLDGYHLNKVVYSETELSGYIQGQGGDISEAASKEEMLTWWRPFSSKFRRSAHVIPILPLPWYPRSYLICEQVARELPIRISQVLADALIRVIDLLLQSPPRLAAEIDCGNMWRQENIYLSYRGSMYARDHLRFLRMGILLPPSRHIPAIIPEMLSAHEYELWRKAIHTL